MAPAGLRVSVYDHAVGLVWALLVLTATAAACLLIMWWTSRIFLTQKTVPVSMQGLGDGSGGEETGLAEGPELQSPEPSELEQEVELDLPQLEETLQTVTDAISFSAAVSEEFTLDPQETGGPRPGRGGGGFGEGGYPGHQRWEVILPAGATLEEYAAMLDGLGIRLGVIAPGGSVLVVDRLSAAAPRVVSATASEAAGWLYFTHKQSRLIEADRELLGKARVSLTNQILVQFYPETLEQRLAQLETGFVGRTPQQIRKTRFGVRLVGGRHDFFVLEQSPLF
jgi:hypothetical protein